jgi:hypothetical protein
MKKLMIIAWGFMFLISCSKEPGEGGKNTIQGYVIKQDYTTSTDQFVTEYPALEERVYIVYGDNAYYADETRTHFDGSFEFDFLYKGEYKIFLYSECLACPGGIEPVIVDIELLERKEILELDTIYIKNYIN